MDDDGVKNFRDMALWIGRNLGQQRRAALEVGAWGIDKLSRLPIFDLDVGDILVLRESVHGVLDALLERAVRTNPLLSPMATPPEPWTGINRGGLPPDHWAKVSLIRGHRRASEEAARKAIGTDRMKKVLDAINILQAVPFTINKSVLDFMLRMGAPPFPSGPRPPIWQRRYKKWQTAANEHDSFMLDTTTAEALAEWNCFFAPLTIDTRGRIYGIPHFSFTREDRVRGLFLFAEGEPIGADGLLWLKAHVAGCADGTSWSLLKKPSEQNFEARIAWTNENLPLLRKIGEVVLRSGDPVDVKWALPKKPFQFIAACAELVLALDGGPDFRTRLPLTFDGSCSGLQHLCAMTRADEGRYVNLTPTNNGDDFYRRVAYDTYQVINPDVEFAHLLWLGRTPPRPWRAHSTAP